MSGITSPRAVILLSFQDVGLHDDDDNDDDDDNEDEDDEDDC